MRRGRRDASDEEGVQGRKPRGESSVALLRRLGALDDNVRLDEPHPVILISSTFSTTTERERENPPQLRRHHLLLHLPPLLQRMLERLPPHVLPLRHQHSSLLIDPSLHLPLPNQGNHLARKHLLAPAERTGHAREGDGRKGGEVGKEGAGTDEGDEVVEVWGEVEVEDLAGLE